MDYACINHNFNIIKNLLYKLIFDNPKYCYMDILTYIERYYTSNIICGESDTNSLDYIIKFYIDYFGYNALYWDLIELKYNKDILKYIVKKFSTKNYLYIVTN